MPHQDSTGELQKSLEAIIEKMRSIQKRIGSGSQPASMHELNALSALGQQYSKLVERLQDSH